MIDNGKGSKIRKEEKGVRKINKNPQSYGIRNMRKEVPISNKLKDHAYE